MNLVFKRLFSGKKSVSTLSSQKKLASRLNEKKLRCVCERVDGIEEIIAKDGVILYRENELIIYGGTDIIFKCDIADMEAGELLSLEGVVITAKDKENSNEERTIIAYYKYWRNIDN